MRSTTKTRQVVGGAHKDLMKEELVEMERRAREFCGRPFTPRMRNGRRIGIVLDNASYDQVRGRGLGNRGIVTDLSTGNQYEIIGAACSIHGCVCDAIAIRVNAQKV